MIPAGVHGTGAVLAEDAGCRGWKGAARRRPLAGSTRDRIRELVQSGRLLNQERGAVRVGVELVDDGVQRRPARRWPAARGGSS